MTTVPKLPNPLSNRYCMATVANMKKVASQLSYWSIPTCWIYEMEKSGIAFNFSYEIPSEYSQVVYTEDLQVWTWYDSWAHYIIKGSQDQCIAYMDAIQHRYPQGGYCTRFKKAQNDMWSGSRSQTCD